MEANKYMRNPDLPGEVFYWEGSPTGFLLIHGFTATTAEVRLIAEKLHQAGYTTAAPLLSGHGTHPDDLNRVKWPMWVENVKQTYEQLMKHCNQIYVIGESMGALVTLELAAQHPEIAGLFLFAPALKVNGLGWARFVAPFKKHLQKSDEDDGLPWKGYNVYPLKASVQLLRLQEHVHKILPSISQPVVVFTGEFDRTISENSADIILCQVASNQKCRIHLSESDHCILLDRELDKAYDNVMAFVSRWG